MKRGGQRDGSHWIVLAGIDQRGVGILARLEDESGEVLQAVGGGGVKGHDLDVEMMVMICCLSLAGNWGCGIGYRPTAGTSAGPAGRDWAFLSGT